MISRIRLDLADVLALAGLILIAAGAAWVYAPAGLIVLGFGFLGLGLMLARSNSE